GQQRYVARAELHLAAVVHHDMKPPGNMVLEVRRLTTLGLDERLDGGRPSPPGFESAPSERDAAKRHQFEKSFIELPLIVGLRKGFFLHLCHDDRPSFCQELMWRPLPGAATYPEASLSAS